MRHSLRWSWVWWLLLGVVGAAQAAAPSVPPALQDWQAWVLHGHEQQACPLLTSSPGTTAGAHQCIWPGRFTLVADRTGGRFALALHADAEGWVALPGDRDTWPRAVRIDDAPAVVLDRDGTPALRVQAGDHVVSGEFEWDKRPSRLRLPAAIALVDLKVDGGVIAQPGRHDDWLTLGAAATAQPQADALSLRVFRRLADGAPPTLDTRIRLHVAGTAREQVLGPVLPKGFVATALDGDLPARLDRDGRLRVQLRPGDWTLTLGARELAPLAKVRAPTPAAPWPRQEIWSYADAPALRTTRVTGAQPIDPAQAEVPPEWRALPAFVMGEGASLEVAQRARGLAQDAGERVSLTRQLWLDFDGGGLTAIDHLTGKLQGTDRLDVAAPWQLEFARTDSASQPLLVTRGPGSGTSGVEVRARDLDLDAGLRRDGWAGTQPATGGWQGTLDGVQATLHLPYGYRLLGAPGADDSPDSWVAQWNLLDLFVAALVGLLAWRLLGWPWGLVVLAFVMLAHGEAGAPVWTVALAVVLGLVARMLPAGRLRSTARYVGIGFLVLAVLVALPFGATQLRDAVYPQLENRSAPWQAGAGMVAPKPEAAGANAAKRAPQEQSVMATPAPPPPPAPPRTLQTITVTGSTAANALAASTYPPGTVVQSGLGIPDWDGIGRSYHIGFSGPVTAQQGWRLVILPSWATRILRIVMLGLLVALLVRLARAFDLRPPSLKPPAAAAVGLACACVLAGIAAPARADSVPSQALLEQLRSRLLEAPKCAPACAASPFAQVAVSGDSVQVLLEVDADARVAFPLPHMDAPATLAEVVVDGKSTAPLVARGDGVWVALDRGVHRVVLQFRLAGDAASAALRFPLPPPNVEVSAAGWQADGVDGTRLLSDTLGFTRQRAAPNDGAAPAPAQVFPPYVQLTRSLSIGLDSRVDNVATRVSPTQGGFTVSVPLLQGEHVDTAGMKVADGRVQVTFAPGQQQVQWSGTLDPAKTLELRAPPFGERAETWQVGSAPLVHLAFAGVPEGAADDDVAPGFHVFRPLPGETLRATITRPAAITGEPVAFDRVALDATRGDRAMESVLSLTTRSTRGGEQVIRLPRDARLIASSRDGQALDLHAREGRVALPVQPGTQQFTLRFRETTRLGTATRTPHVELAAPAANIRTSLELPRDRWVLWTWGPAAGPAVLYWPELLLLLAVAIALARFAPTPLRWWQWLLLGLGFSTFAWSAYVVVVAWLILLGLRARSERVPALEPGAFNTVQVLLGILTVAALLCLVASVPQGLLGRPDMRIVGAGSTGWSLHWFADRSAGGLLPRAGAFSLPLWSYQVAMLAWALWLAHALIGWLRWGFQAWQRGGYWKSTRPSAPPPAPAADG